MQIQGMHIGTYLLIFWFFSWNIKQEWNRHIQKLPHKTLHWRAFHINKWCYIIFDTRKHKKQFALIGLQVSSAFLHTSFDWKLSVIYYSLCHTASFLVLLTSEDILETFPAPIAKYYTFDVKQVSNNYFRSVLLCLRACLQMNGMSEGIFLCNCIDGCCWFKTFRNIHARLHLF